MDIPPSVLGIFFVVISCGLVLAAKMLFRHTLTFQMFSAETVISIGFFVYLILPGATRSEELAMPLWRYALHVWTAYFTVLVGASLVKRCVKREKQALPPVFSVNKKSDAVAGILLILIVAWHLVQLYQAGGFSFILSQWTTNRIMAATLNSADNDVGAGDALGAILLGGTFTVLWSMVLVRWPVGATLVWYAETFCKLSGYTGRSNVLAMLLAPYLVYVILKAVPRRRVIIQCVLLGSVFAILFSWASSFRLGVRYTLSFDQVVHDLIDSTATPIIYGSRFLDDTSYRGSAGNYALAYLAYPVPRVLWPSKPGESMNTAATMQITGRKISAENSYMVFTILAESWYYFGAAGAVALFLPFGALAKSVDLHFSRNRQRIGVYVMLLLYAFFQMRSSVLTYFQMCACYAAVSAVASATLGRRPRRKNAFPAAHVAAWRPEVAASGRVQPPLHRRDTATGSDDLLARGRWTPPTHSYGESAG